jgi:hypothetical protein
MSLRAIAKRCWLVLVPAGFLTLIYSLLGVVGTGMMGPIVSLKDLVAVYYPLLAFPVFCLVFVSLRIATLCLWAYFLLKWGFWLVITWPHVAFNPLSSKADQLLFFAVLLVQVALVLQARLGRTAAAAL